MPTATPAPPRLSEAGAAPQQAVPGRADTAFQRLGSALPPGSTSPVAAAAPCPPDEDRTDGREGQELEPAPSPGSRFRPGVTVTRARWGTQLTDYEEKL